MKRVRYARHALFGGGGFGLLGAAGFGLLYGEVHLARRAIPSLGAAPLADGEYGAGNPGPVLRVAMLGDSSAAGVGCELPSETPGALLANALADRGYHITLDVLAVSGSRSADLEPQVSRCLLNPPHLAVLSIGANDVIKFVKPQDAVPHLVQAIRRLRAADVDVVVATCPDLGMVRPVPQPLRALGRHLSRRMARAQVRASLQEDAVPIDTADLIGPLFAERASEMFCHDRFHPSAAGYREISRVLLHGVLAALDLPASAPTATALRGSDLPLDSGLDPVLGPALDPALDAAAYDAAIPTVTGVVDGPLAVPPEQGLDGDGDALTA